MKIYGFDDDMEKFVKKMVAGYKKNRMIFEEMSFDDIESLIFGAMAVFKELQPDEFMRLLIGINMVNMEPIEDDNTVHIDWSVLDKIDGGDNDSD
jgi:hypothetical protein